MAPPSNWLSFEEYRFEWYFLRPFLGPLPIDTSIITFNSTPGTHTHNTALFHRTYFTHHAHTNFTSSLSSTNLFNNQNSITAVFLSSGILSTGFLQIYRGKSAGTFGSWEFFSWLLDARLDSELAMIWKISWLHLIAFYRWFSRWSRKMKWVQRKYNELKWLVRVETRSNSSAEQVYSLQALLWKKPMKTGRSHTYSNSSLNCSCIPLSLYTSIIPSLPPQPRYLLITLTPPKKTPIPNPEAQPI